MQTLQILPPTRRLFQKENGYESKTYSIPRPCGHFRSLRPVGLRLALVARTTAGRVVLGFVLVLRPSHSGSDDDKNNDDSSSSTATPEELVKVENGTLTVNSTVTELTADMLADI